MYDIKINLYLKKKKNIVLHTLCKILWILLKLSSIPNSELLVASSLFCILLSPHLGPTKTKACSSYFFPLFHLSLQVPFSFHVPLH